MGSEQSVNTKNTVDVENSNVTTEICTKSLYDAVTKGDSRKFIQIVQKMPHANPTDEIKYIQIMTDCLRIAMQDEFAEIYNMILYTYHGLYDLYFDDNYILKFGIDKNDAHIINLFLPKHKNFVWTEIMSRGDHLDMYDIIKRLVKKPDDLLGIAIKSGKSNMVKKVLSIHPAIVLVEKTHAEILYNKITNTTDATDITGLLEIYNMLLKACIYPSEDEFKKMCPIEIMSKVKRADR